jgi:hypothetical protein
LLQPSWVALLWVLATARKNKAATTTVPQSHQIDVPAMCHPFQ